MRPFASSSAIVSREYRHPNCGDANPFHSYIMLGRGFGLVIPGVPRPHQGQRPGLELKFIVLGQLARPGQIGRLADHLVRALD